MTYLKIVSTVTVDTINNNLKIIGKKTGRKDLYILETGKTGKVFY